MALAAPARGAARLTGVSRAPVLRAVITQSWDRPVRQLLIGLVVLVATAFAAASIMLTGAAGATIVRELAGTPQAAAVVVQAAGNADPAQPAALPADAEQKARDTPGVAAVAPFESGTVALSRPGAPGDGEIWAVVTAADGPLGRFPAVAGKLPAGPQDVAISEEAARRTGMKLGDTFALIGATGDADNLVVTGVVAARAQALSTVALAPQVVTQLTGVGPSQLDVQAAAGASAAELEGALRTALGDGVQVPTAAQARSAELSAAFGGGVTAIFAVLALFGITAAVAAALTTFCVFGIVAKRQQRSVLLLRGVGASRGQVLRALLVNAVLTGLVAGILGLALSLGLVQLVRLGIRVAAQENLPTPGLSLTLVLACLAGAVLTTLLAAVGPAVRVSGQRPAAVTAPEVASRQLGRRIQRLAGAAALGAASATACSLAVAEVDQQRALILVVLGGVLAFGAVLAAGPLLLPRIAWLLGIVLTPLSRLPGRIAVRSALRAPQRASIMAATLVLASLLLSVVLIGLQSMSDSVESRIAAKFPADVLTLAAADQPLPADLAARITNLPESGPVTAIQSATMAGGDGVQVTFSAVDPRAFPGLLAGAVDAGSLADLVPGTVALDRSQAAAWQVGVGSPLTFAAPGGPIELKVVAVYRSSGVLQPVTVHPQDLPRIATDAGVRQVLADPADGVSIDALRGAVAQVVGPDPGVQVLAPADFRAELERAVQLTRMVAFGLVGATVLVALCGVAVGLALGIRERHRESTTLRALGLTRGQVVAAIGLESGLLGLAGVLVGTGLGLVFGALAVFALRERAVLPLDVVLAGSGVLVLVAIIAGVLPALVAARRSPLPAIVD
jgi:putative ABC transport system permease protein